MKQFSFCECPDCIRARKRNRINWILATAIAMIVITDIVYVNYQQQQAMNDAKEHAITISIPSMKIVPCPNSGCPTGSNSSVNPIPNVCQLQDQIPNPEFQLEFPCQNQ